MKNISVHDLYLDAIEITFEYFIKWSSVVIENNAHFVPSIMPCNSNSLQAVVQLASYHGVVTSCFWADLLFEDVLVRVSMHEASANPA